MNDFPSTSQTLLEKLAAEATGEVGAAWTRFFSLYTPVMKRFVQMVDHNHDPDDVVQDVYMHLVKILSERRYDAGKSQFRTFLKMLIRRRLIGMYRRERSHGAGAGVSLDDLQESLIVQPEQGVALDLAWEKARREAAVRHVLTKTALSAKTKAVYRAHVLEGKSAEEVCREFGIDDNHLRQIKFRVEKAISLVEAELSDEDTKG
ncbi:MAG: sigma-70 family RNA polymerase sigma factor [Kiritimatiellae bacterium]|nr:sigma-70 family RNA polymerase sigma factor [Kiritimatiellia bacterium]